MWLTSMAVVAVGAALEGSSPAASTDAAAADVCPACPLWVFDHVNGIWLKLYKMKLIFH